MGIEIKKEPEPKKTQRLLTIGEYDDDNDLMGFRYLEETTDVKVPPSSDTTDTAPNTDKSADPSKSIKNNAGPTIESDTKDENPTELIDSSTDDTSENAGSQNGEDKTKKEKDPSAGKILGNEETSKDAGENPEDNTKVDINDEKNKATKE